MRARKIYHELEHLLPTVPIEEANVVVAIGGDGFMLHTLHYLNFLDCKLPVFGINAGTVGFLLNNPSNYADIISSIQRSSPTPIYALMVNAVDAHNESTTLMAFNEISLLRYSAQTCKINILINDQSCMENFSGDGLIVATPLGSSAYNFSAGSQILPLGCNLIALTPICGFRPKGWRGAILPDHYKIELINADYSTRPLKITADQQSISKIKSVVIKRSNEPKATLLFDSEYSLEKRIIREQFS